MNIYITSATPFETQPLKEMVERNALQHVHFHTSGVGLLQSSFSIQKLITAQSPGLLIQVGIAGTFDQQCPLGDVVLVKEELLGTCGVEENGKWKDMFDLNLSDKDSFPFHDKSMKNPWLQRYNLLRLKEVRAISVDEITTGRQRAMQLIDKYHPFVESMEGASLHYCALQYDIPFFQVRGISNYVGERNKEGWKMRDAVENVCAVCFELIGGL